MKKRIIKAVKGFFLFMALMLIVFVTAILWPMPTFELQKKESTILIKSITIIDVKTGDILKNRDVLIENNYINDIDTAGIIKASKTALIINGEEKYMIPGLWDLHTHSNQHSPWLHHPLYIANGVTGIRDMSGTLDKEDSYWVGSKKRMQWNNDLKTNRRVTPRYVLQSSMN